MIIERAHDLLLARQGVHGLDAMDYRPVEGIQLAVLVLNSECDVSTSQSRILHGSQGAAVRTNDLGISAQTAEWWNPLPYRVVP